MQFNFKKKFGQNFLNDENVINNIASSINPGEDDLIIEIGPGSGALTKYLVKKNCYLRCYEIDTELDKFLIKYNSDKVKVIYSDFLKANIIDDIKNINYKNLYIIGNLPYYITTPIIMHILELNLNIKEMVFMVQKEVAERFSALPGSKDYGSISVFLNYYYDIQKLFIVKRDKFTPSPNVDSEVIKFVSHETKDVDFTKFNKIIKKAFLMKRKNLRNNFKGNDLDQLDKLLKDCGKDLSFRAEDLTLDDYIYITNNFVGDIK